MSTTDRDRVIEKIKKCLRLSKSSNEHEAAAALRQAQKLMAAHQLDQTEVDQAEVKEAGARAYSTAIPRWEASLAHMVAEAFGCEMYVSRSVARTWIGAAKRRSEFMFVGVGAAAELAQYAHQVLSRQCAAARSTHMAKQPRACKQATKTARGDVFAMGWVMAVRPLVGRFAGTEREQRLLAGYMARVHPDMGSIKPKARELGRNVRDDSWVAGHQAGRAAQLRQGLGDGPEVKRLGA